MTGPIISITTEANQQLKNFRYDNDSPCALIIETPKLTNFIPPTPKNGFYIGNELRREESLVNHILEMSGKYPISYPDENGGIVYREVVPNLSKAIEHSSHGYKKPFGPHTDNPDRHWSQKMFGKIPIPPYLLLQGIRNPDSVGTRIISIETILKHLNKQVIQDLALNEYQIITPSSGTQIRTMIGATILAFHKRFGVLVRYDESTTSALTPRAEYALECFQSILSNDDLWEEVILTPGKILFFKNMKCLHSRPAFCGRGDGRDRWLRRVYAADKENLNQF